jgi:hypothetical protein
MVDRANFYPRLLNVTTPNSLRHVALSGSKDVYPDLLITSMPGKTKTSIRDGAAQQFVGRERGGVFRNLIHPAMLE